MLIEYFEEFITLAIHRNYSSAARALNISQPSMSRHIAALERELGHQLIYNSVPLSLTAAGEVVLKYASDIMTDYQTMTTALRTLPKSPDTRRVQVLDLLHVNTLFIGITEAIAKAKEALPGTCLEYCALQGRLDPMQMLEEGKVDISFDFSISEEKLAAQELPEEFQSAWLPEFHGELCFAVAKSSPYAQCADIGLAELAHEHFILPATQTCNRFRSDFIGICNKAGFSPRIIMVPVNNYLGFYYADPGDAIHILSRLSRRYSPLISAPVKANCKILSPRGTKHYVNAFALALSKPRNEVVSYVFGHLEEHAQRLVEEGALLAD
jgi:DNA-binding transcriptional LysR family regulator